MSAKVRKLANFDPSRAKQPDMIGNIVNNNKSSYEMMFGEITGEGKNNKTKKNNLDLIRLGVFMKDALDILVKKTKKDRIVFSWQCIGNDFCYLHNCLILFVAKLFMYDSDIMDWVYYGIDCSRTLYHD